MTTGMLVIVVGKAASGKTTLCKSLATFGFTYVSASDVLRRALGSQAQDRRSLAERGDTVRGTKDFATFHDALLGRIREAVGGVVLDGPRFAETVDCIRRSFGHSLLVYLDCPDVVRRRRLDAEGRSSDWAWLAQHPTETSVTEMRDMADVLLDGARPASDLLWDLQQRIRA